MNCTICFHADSDNLDNDIRFVIVKNPMTGAWVRRCWMCATHRDYYRNRGYEVVV